MFYNTNKTEDLAKANADTKKQDEIILALFKKHFALSPWQASDLSGIFITWLTIFYRGEHKYIYDVHVHNGIHITNESHEEKQKQNP
jgi:hypothetical protein